MILNAGVSPGMISTRNRQLNGLRLKYLDQALHNIAMLVPKLFDNECNALFLPSAMIM